MKKVILKIFQTIGWVFKERDWADVSAAVLCFLISLLVTLISPIWYPVFWLGRWCGYWDKKVTPFKWLWFND